MKTTWDRLKLLCSMYEHLFVIYKFSYLPRTSEWPSNVIESFSTKYQINLRHIHCCAGSGIQTKMHRQTTCARLSSLLVCLYDRSLLSSVSAFNGKLNSERTFSMSFLAENSLKKFFESPAVIYVYAMPLSMFIHNTLMNFKCSRHGECFFSENSVCDVCVLCVAVN